jgi:hypothetical protein
MQIWHVAIRVVKNERDVSFLGQLSHWHLFKHISIWVDHEAHVDVVILLFFEIIYIAIIYP